VKGSRRKILRCEKEEEKENFFFGSSSGLNIEQMKVGDSGR
jgi:hypothetical protein